MFVDHCFSCSISFGHCIVCPLIYVFSLLLWYLQPFLTSPRFIKVVVPIHESELSCICVLSVSILPLSAIFLLNFAPSDGLAFFAFHLIFYSAIIFLDNDDSCCPVFDFLFLSVVVVYTCAISAYHH